MKSEQIDRRLFLRGAAVSSATLAALPVTLRSQSKGEPDTMRVGVIGPGSRGTTLLKECIEFGSTYNARVTAVSDIWTKNLMAAAKTVKESYGIEPKAHRDYRKILDDPEIDAVIIATPDHQHSKMLQESIEAGKDVYVEKPLGNDLNELNAAFKAVEQSDRIVQVGTQRRSWPRYRAAMDMMQSGQLGDVLRVEVYWNAYSPYRWARNSKQLTEVKEEDVDWKAFLMGKPDRPFDARIFRSFRLFREFSSAIVDQWMTHGVDVIHMLTGELYPRAVVALGDVYRFKDYRENPDMIQVLLNYGEGDKAFMASYGTCLTNASGSGTRVLGTRGTLYAEDFPYGPDERDVKNKWRISGDGIEGSEALKESRKIPEKPGTRHHMANWLDCMQRRSVDDLYAPPIAGYGHSVACIMAVDAMWSGRRMVFDPVTRQINEG